MNYNKFFLLKAIKLAKLGQFTTSPNPNVGCIIVKNNAIVGQGYHLRAGEPHAEINALSMAGEKAKGSTVYVTLEPCCHYGLTPPCTQALINAGINKIIIAMSDVNPKVAGKGIMQLKQAGIEVIHDIMKKESQKINTGFIKRISTGNPLIRLKLASSIDGRTALLSKESKWITSIQSRKDVQYFRAKSDVILSTASTVLADNPILNVRWSFLPKKIKKIYPQNNLRQPIRVIIDINNKINTEHQIIKNNNNFPIWLIRQVIDIKQTWPKSVKQIILPVINKKNKKYLDLEALIFFLGKQKFNYIWIEAGATLAGSLINENLVDELILYQAPKLLGSDALPLCNISNILKLNNVPIFNIINVKKIGSDIRLYMKPNKQKLINNKYR